MRFRIYFSRSSILVQPQRSSSTSLETVIKWSQVTSRCTFWRGLWDYYSSYSYSSCHSSWSSSLSSPPYLTIPSCSSEFSFLFRIIFFILPLLLLVFLFLPSSYSSSSSSSSSSYLYSSLYPFFYFFITFKNIWYPMLYPLNINIAITNFIGTFTEKGQKHEQRRAP